MPTTPLFPLPEGLEITAISQATDGLLVRVISNRTSCPCPICRTSSEAVHSRYRRHPLELPCAGQRVQLLLSVHPCFCRVPTCPRNVFTERLPELLQPNSRLPTRLRSLLQAIGLAFNGQGSARLSEPCGIKISRVTLLRSLQLLPEPGPRPVRMVGVDDFAWKRGKRYGTVLIDLETHDVLDLLPDREAESVKRWPAAPPDLEIVSRDRGGAYADGAAQGAPQAEQVADRWHRCKHVGDALEQAVLRLRISVPAKPSGETPCSKEECAPAVPEAIPVARTPRLQAMLQRKQEQTDRIKQMDASGQSMHAVASQPGLARKTVRRSVRMEGGHRAHEANTCSTLTTTP